MNLFFITLLTLSSIYSVASEPAPQETWKTRYNCEFELIDSSWETNTSVCNPGVSCYDEYENSCTGDTIKIHKFCVAQAINCPR